MPLPSLGRLSSRTNLKAASSSGRHRGAAKPADDGVVEDTELTSYLAALAPENDLESTGSGKRFGEAQVYQLRMSLIASQQLKDIAGERGISPQALAQEWILERLNWEGQASSLQDQRQQAGHAGHAGDLGGAGELGVNDLGGLSDLTDEFHFPADAFDAPVGGRRH